VAAATAACREVAGSDRQLPSGPLHDAAEMARRVPTVMIFSSSTNGLSHTKEEDTPVAHLELAARAYGSTARTTIELCAERA
jgi:N-carbamoyl-L-amino-acid hydrolase